MTTPEIFVNSLNALSLLLVMYLAIIIIRASTTYTWNPTNDGLKNRMKFRILKSLLAMIAIGMAAVVINLVFISIYK